METPKLWQIEIRSDGKPVSDITEARRILAVLNLDLVGENPTRLGVVEPEDPEGGVWLAELPARYDDDLNRGEEWFWHEPLESGDGYEVWLPQP